MTYLEFIIKTAVSLAGNPAFCPAGFNEKKPWAETLRELKQWAVTIVTAAIELEKELSSRQYPFDEGEVCDDANEQDDPP